MLPATARNKIESRKPKQLAKETKMLHRAEGKLLTVYLALGASPSTLHIILSIANIQILMSEALTTNNQATS